MLAFRKILGFASKRTKCPRRKVLQEVAMQLQRESKEEYLEQLFHNDIGMTAKYLFNSALLGEEDERVLMQGKKKIQMELGEKGVGCLSLESVLLLMDVMDGLETLNREDRAILHALYRFVEENHQLFSVKQLQRVERQFMFITQKTKLDFYPNLHQYTLKKQNLFGQLNSSNTPEQKHFLDSLHIKVPPQLIDVSFAKNKPMHHYVQVYFKSTQQKLIIWNLAQEDQLDMRKLLELKEKLVFFFEEEKVRLDSKELLRSARTGDSLVSEVSLMDKKMTQEYVEKLQEDKETFRLNEEERVIYKNVNGVSRMDLAKSLFFQTANKIKDTHEKYIYLLGNDKQLFDRAFLRMQIGNKELPQDFSSYNLERSNEEVHWLLKASQAGCVKCTGGVNRLDYPRPFFKAFRHSRRKNQVDQVLSLMINSQTEVKQFYLFLEDQSGVEATLKEVMRQINQRKQLDKLRKDTQFSDYVKDVNRWVHLKQQKSREADIRRDILDPTAEMDPQLLNLAILNNLYFHQFQEISQDLVQESDRLGAEDKGTFDKYLETCYNTMFAQQQDLMEQHDTSGCFAGDVWQR